jgi:hypothetical protein
MPVLRRAAEWTAIALIVGAYLFFASAGTMRFTAAPDPPRGWDNPGGGYYAQLAEGFLRGDTHFPIAPDPRMATLADPYDYGARDRLGISYLWDASYYRGRYYLYFTPLPAVLFYVPYRLVTGHHADDPAAAAFFSAWALIAGAMFLRRALRGDRSRVLWIVFAGLANLIPFSLSSARVYEVAILCATAMSATWAWALLRFDENPSPRAAMWMALWLSLAIAARPNLLVLVIPAAVILWRQEPRVRVRAMLFAAIPVVLTACGYLGYNAARFGNPLESGISYQLTYVPMRGLSRCSICSGPEVVRFASNALQYQFTPPRLSSRFPHAEAATAHIDKRVSWPGGEPEEIVGIVPLVPLALIGTLLALLLARRARIGAAILAGAWLVLFGLSSCWWIVSRYALDFQLLMLLGTAVCVEEGLALRPGRWLRIAVALLALYSIILGLLFGLEGRGGAFRGQNPWLMG